MSKDSRTTKRAAAILRKDRVRVAIPVSANVDDSEPSGGGWFATLRGVPRWSKNNDMVLAFTDQGTALLSVRPSNPGIPHALLARTESFPTLVDEDEDGLTVDLDGAEYRVGLMHRESMRSVLENAPTPQDAAETEEPEPIAERPQDTIIEPEPRPEPEAESAGSIATTAEPEPEPEPADAAEPVPQTRTAAARRQVNDWASSLERGLLTPELPRGHVESRSRPTMQCQRLLKDTYVHLSVPAKAQPRQGTDDPKGHFVIAFTDDGIEHFTANRSNKASPGEHLGKLETAHPAVFEPADKKARHGGTLTIGTRQFTIPLLYVNSLTEYLEDAAE